MTQLEILPRPPDERSTDNPWPQWSMIYRVSSAHEEGGERIFSVNTERFVDDGHGNVRALLLHEVELRDGRFAKIEGTERELPADLVLLAMGFVGPERGAWLDQLGVEFDARGNIARDASYMTSVPGVFVAGDMGRGQSLIVWAIAEGRSCAAAVDEYLVGETSLPAPIEPTARPLISVPRPRRPCLAAPSLALGRSHRRLPSDRGAFPGHAGRVWPLPRWRSVARIGRQLSRPTNR